MEVKEMKAVRLILFAVAITLAASAAVAESPEGKVPELAAYASQDAELVVRVGNISGLISVLCDESSGYGFAREFAATLEDEMAKTQVNFFIEKALGLRDFLAGDLSFSLIYLLEGEFSICAKLREESEEKLLDWLEGMGLGATRATNVDESFTLYRIPYPETELWLAIRENLMFLSNLKEPAVLFAQGKPPFENSLADNAEFKETVLRLGHTDFMVYSGFGRLLDGAERSMSKLGREMYLALGLDRFRAAGLSYHIGEHSTAAAFDLTISDTSLGLPAMISFADTSSEAIKYIPADYDLCLRFSTEHLPLAWQAYLDFVRKVVAVSGRHARQCGDKIDGFFYYSLASGEIEHAILRRHLTHELQEIPAARYSRTVSEGVYRLDNKCR